MKNKYLSRITSSARGETFNPLTWPFLFGTLAYGVGFLLLFFPGDLLGTSSLFVAMSDVHAGVPLVWGITCILTIVGGLTFLLFNIPPFGKVSGLVGFSAWAWAASCYVATGNWAIFFAVTVPNMWFWMWQYLSLSLFRREDAKDLVSLLDYDEGLYDNPKDSDAQEDRENNRGVDRQ